MAIKTFNPNRTVGGTFSLVRAADGTYSVKENGFESLGVLNLPELSDSAVTTSTTKTDTAADIQILQLKTKLKKHLNYLNQMTIIINLLQKKC